MGNTLKTTKAGDAVKYRTRNLYRWYEPKTTVARVERTTATMVILENGMRFRRNGHEVGAAYSPCAAEPATNDDIAAFEIAEQAKNAAILIINIASRGFKMATPEQIIAMYQAYLDNKPKEEE